MIQGCIPDEDCEVVDLSKDANIKATSTLETPAAYNSRKWV